MSSDGRGPYVQLLTGTQWHFYDPRPEDVRFEDLRALTKVNRYLGATTGQAYSVAEHCARGARWLASIGHDRSTCLAFLLHDPEHIPPGDLPGPMVRWLELRERQRQKTDPKYQDETLRIRRLGERAVWGAFGVLDVFEDIVLDSPIWHADRVMLATERRDLMAPSSIDWGKMPEPLPERIVPWSHTRAWDEFCATFDALGGKRP